MTEPPRNPTQTIRLAVLRVQNLRLQCSLNPALADALRQIKGFQCHRFEHTYSDLLSGGPYQGATRYFLAELYGDRDYSERDAQFARIAGALQRLFPKAVVATAVRLAQLHALTEELDFQMAQALVAGGWQAGEMSPRDYVRTWGEVGRRPARMGQLQQVVHLGQDLDRLTRAPGLRMLLKMMRGPARSAGMSDLQDFLEAGFDTFADIERRSAAAGGSASTAKFLTIIQERETHLIKELFDGQLDLGDN
jgi:hypothetical protein